MFTSTLSHQLIQIMVTLHGQEKNIMLLVKENIFLQLQKKI